ncbi:hypothetical protein NDU88_004123 [Pleurodeles waltl]|uniref:Uncharacterized protein n=1 Tax=Pleurodeles waltl TaxID=8319 RepID=A0AAV7T7A5_PLEWA|nr:hypothetical protein NDU88_004123 [Pleurodeles waltl]
MQRREPQLTWELRGPTLSRQFSKAEEASQPNEALVANGNSCTARLLPDVRAHLQMGCIITPSIAEVSGNGSSPPAPLSLGLNVQRTVPSHWPGALSGLHEPQSMALEASRSAASCQMRRLGGGTQRDSTASDLRLARSPCHCGAYEVCARL